MNFTILHQLHLPFFNDENNLHYNLTVTVISKQCTSESASFPTENNKCETLNDSQNNTYNVLVHIPKTSQKSFLGLHSGKMPHFGSNKSFFQIFTVVTLIYSHCLEIYISTQDFGKTLKTDFENKTNKLFLHTYIHTNLHTYIHTYKHTYIHTYIHIYIQICPKRVFPV